MSDATCKKSLQVVKERLTTDDLVDRVALAIADAYYRSASSGQLTLQDTDTIPEDWEAEARAAIALALEEAAKMAESFTTPPVASDFGTVIVDQGGEIAAAIRALIPQEPA